MLFIFLQLNYSAKNRLIHFRVLSLHWFHLITALFTCSIYANEVT